FYNVAADEFGMGTVSPIEQYDAPLRQVGSVSVRRGDEALSEAGIGHVSAMKIDVQGFEPEGLRGFHATLDASRPIVWLEIGIGTTVKMDTFEALAELFPYPIKAFRFAMSGTVRRRCWPEPASPGALPHGDYLVAPV